MKKLIYVALIAGVFFGTGVAVHSLLVSAAQGDGTWSTRAASTCAACHGG